MRKFMRSVLVSALALTAGVAAHAASDTTEFKVRITITESCDISTVAATDVDFLTHARSSAASSIDAQGNLAVTCTKDTPYAIALDMGQNSAGSVASATNRRMVLTGNYVPYGLYRDASRTQLWGNVAGTGGDTLTGTGTAALQSIPVYGRVLADAINVPAGVYLDTVRATISY